MRDAVIRDRPLDQRPENTAERIRAEKVVSLLCRAPTKESFTEASLDAT